MVAIVAAILLCSCLHHERTMISAPLRSTVGAFNMRHGTLTARGSTKRLTHKSQRFSKKHLSLSGGFMRGKSGKEHVLPDKQKDHPLHLTCVDFLSQTSFQSRRPTSISHRRQFSASDLLPAVLLTIIVVPVSRPSSPYSLMHSSLFYHHVLHAVHFIVYFWVMLDT